MSELVLFHQILPCVSIAPFGRPVVPLVYMMTATSSSVTVTPDRIGSFAPISSSVEGHPSAD